MQIENLMQTKPLKLKDLSEASPDDESLSDKFEKVSIKDIQISKKQIKKNS